MFQAFQYLLADYQPKEYDMKFPINFAMAIRRRSWFLIPRIGSFILRRHNVNALMIVLFGLLNVADGVVTYLGLSVADVIEVNPILNYFAGLLGLGVAIVLLKLAILIIIAYIFFDRHSIQSRLGTVTLASADTFYGWVVFSNSILFMGI
jgi:uncharacterized membrane protein